MVVSTTKMTARQYFMLGEDPPGVRLELVDGEIAVAPGQTPSHSRVITSLMMVLQNDARLLRSGTLFANLDLPLDDFNVRRPDLMFFFNEHQDRVGKDHLEGMPDLAVEVVSPESNEIDRVEKFERYQAARVKHYWIVDPILKSVEGWELKRGKYVSISRAKGTETIRLAPFPDLEIPLKELWRK